MFDDAGYICIRTVVIEIVMHFESGRGDLFHGAVMFVNIEVLTGVHLEDHVSLVCRALYLGGQVFGG